MKKLQPTILLVDDDPNDLFLLETALGAASVAATLRPMLGGREAIAYLSGHGQYADRSGYGLPDFIVTDLKMPGVDGFGILEFLKATPELATIPAVILSGSSDNDDIRKSYWLGAASYHVKPSDPAELCSLVKALHSYWITCEFPDKGGAEKTSAVEGGFKLGDRFVGPSRAG